MVGDNSMCKRIAVPTDTDWEQLHAFKLEFGDCWKNCGSYCCKTNHPQQDFSLMKQESAGMVFMSAEYDFLARHLRLQDGFEETHRRHRFVFNEERNLAIEFDTAVCDLGGICSMFEYRPLICKFYPYYPVMSPVTREIDQFITGSLIDQYWEDLNIQHPCWLHRVKGDQVKQAVRAAASAMDHPYFVFCMGAAAIFVEHVTQRCRADHAELLQGDPRQFFRQWEVLYLTMKMIDKKVLAADINDFYELVERAYGAFEL
ncbi:hypothetical protein [Thalassospira australica]|uniref:hypothetical protein n=1 Tax=Thalassospira australica TaxID=1528106 RepID=UPI000519FD52|nr:hypothetical protein [Thalassospira australica]